MAMKRNKNYTQSIAHLFAKDGFEIYVLFRDIKKKTPDRMLSIKFE